MKKIGAAQFKEQCLELLTQLDADGLVITKHGKPVARVLPYEDHDTPGKGNHAHLIGSLRGKVVVTGDVSSTGIKWEADA